MARSARGASIKAPRPPTVAPATPISSRRLRGARARDSINRVAHGMTKAYTQPKAIPAPKPVAALPVQLRPCRYCGAAVRPTNLERHVRTKCPKNPQKLRVRLRQKTADLRQVRKADRAAARPKKGPTRMKHNGSLPTLGSVSRPFQGGLCNGR